jgi:hypothetical protein
MTRRWLQIAPLLLLLSLEFQSVTFAWSSSTHLQSHFSSTKVSVLQVLEENHRRSRDKRRLSASNSGLNEYDNWRSDTAVAPRFEYEQENVQHCIDLLVQSKYGSQMFGVREKASSIGVTGSISLVETDGPTVIISLSGQFWHATL